MQPERLNHDDTLSSIRALIKKPASDSHSLYSFKSNILNKPPEYLDSHSDLKVYFKNVYDWHLVFLSSGKNSPDLRIFIGKYFYFICFAFQIFIQESYNYLSSMNGGKLSLRAVR